MNPASESTSRGPFILSVLHSCENIIMYKKECIKLFLMLCSAISLIFLCVVNFAEKEKNEKNNITHVSYINPETVMALQNVTVDFMLDYIKNKKY